MPMIRMVFMTAVLHASAPFYQGLRDRIIVPMRRLAWLRLDSFTLPILAAGLLALVLPCRGETARLVGIGGEVATRRLFFLQGARLSRRAAGAGVRHWRLHPVLLSASFVGSPLLRLA